MTSFAEFTFNEVPRPGRDNDLAEQAAALILQGLHDKPSPTREELDTTLTGMDNYITFTAVDALEIVAGTGALRFFAGEDNDEVLAAVVNVVVAPDARKQGLGKWMVARLEEEASKLGSKETVLTAAVELADYYERLGYRHTRGNLYTKTLADAR
jgi:GNAT superfamily N-acetyltransferase